MARLNLGDLVKVVTSKGVAYGRVAGLTQDSVYTDFPTDKVLYMTLHITEVENGDFEVDTWETCAVESILIHYDAPEDDPLHPSQVSLDEGEDF